MQNIKNIKIRLLNILRSLHFSNPSKKLKVIGVTGTNGKTTMVTLLYNLAIALGYKAGLISTVEVLINGKVFDIKRLAPTTPETATLYKILNKMVEEKCEYVFMEVSSHAMDQNRVAGINFTGGIFSNLTHDHLDYHKNFENYFRAKKKFFEMLPKESFALSNIDDDHGIAMLDGIKADAFTYGFEDKAEFADFYGKILKSNFLGLELDFNGEVIKSKLLGKFNAYNLLAVWSASKLLNFDIKKVNHILENINPPRGRFDHFMSPTGALVIVDYAHTPDALEKVLLTVKQIKSEEGRIISVFGCGGDRDPLKRAKMGKIGANLSDIVIFTSDNPRSEDPDKIIEEMRDKLVHEESVKVVTIADRRLAIKQAMELAQKGDIILCAGKGHEDYQEIKGVKHHFDDIEEFKKLF